MRHGYRYIPRERSRNLRQAAENNHQHKEETDKTMIGPHIRTGVDRARLCRNATSQAAFAGSRCSAVTQLGLHSKEREGFCRPDTQGFGPTTNPMTAAMMGFENPAKASVRSLRKALLWADEVVICTSSLRSMPAQKGPSGHPVRTTARTVSRASRW